MTTDQDENLLTESEIVASATLPGARKIGIYFLIKDGELKYVGQSTDVEARVFSHRWREFDAWHWVLCDPIELNRLERAYIDKFLPQWNCDSRTVAMRGDNRGPPLKLPTALHPLDGVDRAAWFAATELNWRENAEEAENERRAMLEKMARLRAMRSGTRVGRS